MSSNTMASFASIRLRPMRLRHQSASQVCCMAAATMTSTAAQVPASIHPSTSPPFQPRMVPRPAHSDCNGLYTVAQRERSDSWIGDEGVVN